MTTRELQAKANSHFNEQANSLTEKYAPAATHYFTRNELGEDPDPQLYIQCVEEACEEAGISVTVKQGRGCDRSPRGMGQEFYDALNAAYDEYMESVTDYEDED